MSRRRDLLIALAGLLAARVADAAEAAREAPKGGMLFDGGSLGNRKEPITVTSDRLEYDYKANVVVYRGDVAAIQGEAKLKTDVLTVTFDNSNRDPGAKPAPPPDDPSGNQQQRIRDIVAVGNVRIDNGTRWATGGRAVFDQTKRTVTLTEDPVLHDGSNEVAGERVVVYLDENRSVVEGGRKRVKAVLYPGKNGGLAPESTAAATP